MDLKIGGHYNFSNQPERLVFLGKSGVWNQFAKVSEPLEVWCEVLDVDLFRLEETVGDKSPRLPQSYVVQRLISAAIAAKDYLSSRSSGEALAGELADAVDQFRDYITFAWGVEDVLSIEVRRHITAQSLGMTEEEAWRILGKIKAHYDAGIGVSWDVIQYHADNWVAENFTFSDEEQRYVRRA